ncbi:MAG TPA: hypothetical protein VFE46_18010 [Pirellulales bacterium]|jgi:hypothetical protein|nr:hypothetical protein [Pirellulales bacterium]
MIKRPAPFFVILIIAVAGAVAAFTIWLNYRQSYRVIQAFSSQVTQLIAYAPQAVIIQLVIANTNTANDSRNNPPGHLETIRIQNRSYIVALQKNAIGLDHFADLRHWLLHNDNYDWNATPHDSIGTWQYLIVFSDGDRQASLAFDLDHQLLIVHPDGVPVSFAPMQEGLQAFFQRQF